MNASFALLPGDGIGPEIVAEARNVLEAVADAYGRTFDFTQHLVGGCAIDSTGMALPSATLQACRASDAVLLGAVGGPEWSDPTAEIRPEDGLLGLRKELGLYGNIRPVRTYDVLLDASPLRPNIVAGTDIVFFRELTGRIYFGGDSVSDDGNEVVSHMRYDVGEVERIVRMAATAARDRSKRLTSVDKANVLSVSRLWRRTTERVMADEFPDIELEHVLVDAMAMYLLSRPTDFDVVVTGNMFGDILTDEASMLVGSLGLLPSASLGSGPLGLYEPIHGSAPDIAGKGIANPLATILAAAMALRYSLKLEEEARAIENAVESVLQAGLRTSDIAAGGESVGTREMGEAVTAKIRDQSSP